MHIELSGTLSEEHQNMRLDAAAALLFPEYSRTRLQNWIEAGELLLDGQEAQAKHKVKAGQQIEIDAELIDTQTDHPEPMDLDIIYEDEHLLVINKPAGLVVHPAAGNLTGTLLNGLLYYLPQSAQVPRAGIIHRLDKDTSGLLMVAKTIEAQLKLSDMLKNREISRHYLAITNGVVPHNMTINARIGRHPTDRTKMAVLLGKGLGKEAITHCEVLERFSQHSLIEARLETGRTHQIRVHMAYKKFPLLGDPLYGPRTFIPKNADAAIIEQFRNFKRQALCAYALFLNHPITGQPIELEISLPEDMQAILDTLYSEHHSTQRPNK